MTKLAFGGTVMKSRRGTRYSRPSAMRKNKWFVSLESFDNLTPRHHPKYLHPDTTGQNPSAS
jgi:hypothetical protein